MRRFQTLTLCIIIVAVSVITLGTVNEAKASHISTDCKWDFPWPRRIEYFIYTSPTTPSQFASGEATRVSYGGATWTAVGLNLYFGRVSSLVQTEGYAYGGSYIAKGALANHTRVAETTHTWFTNAGGTDCNRDEGRPIVRALTIFNEVDYDFHFDCKGYATTCVTNDLYDLHDTSSHEFGHWFNLRDTDAAGDFAMTMYGHTAPGTWYRRDLTSHDEYSACVMYGYQGGSSC